MEKTEIVKTYKFGFVLSEQELRRIVQACQQHILKNVDPKDCRQVASAYLSDGSVVVSGTVDSMLSLENSGSKSIERIVLHFDDGKMDYEKPNAPDPDWDIWVRFQNGKTRSTDWASVSYYVIGQSRDWVFLTASEIDERIRKVKIPSLSQMFDSRWFIAVPAVLGFVLTYIGLTLISQNKYTPIPTLLENAYKSGQIKDPIEALIFVEKIKETPMQITDAISFGLWATVAWVIPFGIAWLASKILPWLIPPYNFCWGDYVAFYDRRRNMQTIFLTVIVLGLLVSIASGLLLRIWP